MKSNMNDMLIGYNIFKNSSDYSKLLQSNYLIVVAESLISKGYRFQKFKEI